MKKVGFGMWYVSPFEEGYGWFVLGPPASLLFVWGWVFVWGFVVVLVVVVICWGLVVYKV